MIKATKNIKISEKNQKWLKNARFDMRCETVDDVIDNLIAYYEGKERSE